MFLKHLLVALSILAFQVVCFSQNEQTIDDFWPSFKASVEAEDLNSLSNVSQSAITNVQLQSLFKDEIKSQITDADYVHLQCADIDSDPFPYLDQFEISILYLYDPADIDRKDEVIEKAILIFGRVNGAYQLIQIQGEI